MKSGKRKTVRRKIGPRRLAYVLHLFRNGSKNLLLDFTIAFVGHSKPTQFTVRFVGLYGTTDHWSM